MKLVFTLLCSLKLACNFFAQSGNVTVFSENGEKFTLSLNSEKKNESPAASVKVNGLTGEWYQARIDFEDIRLKDFSNNNFRIHQGYDVTYMIRKNKKGEYVLRFASENPTPHASAGTEGGVSEDVKRYAIADDEAESQASSAPQKTTANLENKAIQNTATTTSVSSVPAGTEPTSVNVNMSVDGMTMGVNMDITEAEMKGSESVRTTTTTTTTTTNTATGASSDTGRPAARPLTHQETVPSGRCARSMDESSYNKALKSITSRNFEDSKLTVAKQVTNANCLTTDQIIGVMGQFSFEETKIDFAKYAYDYCFNKTDYYQVSEAFTFDSSIDELNTYIGSK